MRKTKQWLVTASLLLCSVMVSAYDFKVNGITYTITSEIDLTVEVAPGGEYDETVSIPSRVTYNSKTYRVTSIGEAAFRFRLLSSVTIPSSVTNISENAFYYCEDLYSVVIPEGVVSIGSSAFGCTPISEVRIPSSVKEIGSGAFGGRWDACYDCDDYMYVYYPKTYYVDSNNEAYSSYDGVLYDKSQTTLIDCPCGKTDDLNIPSSVTVIHQWAFSDCYPLGDIYCNATTPPTLSSTIPGTHVLYVPMEVMADYADASNWNEMTIQSLMPEGYTGLTMLFGKIFGDWYWKYTDAYYDTIAKREYSFTAKCGDVLSLTYSMLNYDMGFRIRVNGVVAKSIYKGGLSSGDFSYVFAKDGDYIVTIECQPYDNALNEWAKIENVKLGRAVYTQQRIELDGWTSTNKDHSSKSSHTYTFTADAGATFSFDWATSTEQGYDKLTCELDGTTILTQSGTNSGTYSNTLTSSGEHTFIVAYSKDGSNSTGNDQVSVKNITAERTFDNYANIGTGTLDDASPNFTVYETTNVKQLTYTRTFNNTDWQALYVPFEIPVTEEFLANFEVADLNDIRQYDRDDDGVKDETVVEAFKVTSGTLEANYPYLIRAKEVGEKTITVADATLYTTEENSIDCSSVHEKYTFTGSYNTISSNGLKDCYALSGGVWQPVAESASLGAFRFYLKIESRDGNAQAAQSIKMRVIGDDTTEIENLELEIENSTFGAVYDLQGRRVANPTKGVYIVNGKKVLY